jgi:signal transduction histidine kinase
MAVFLLAGGPYALVLLGPALAVHTLMTRYPPRQLVLLLLAVPVALSAGFWTRPYGGLDDPGLYLAVILGTAGILLPGLVALVLTTRREARRQDALAERRRRADEERLQIAREVHDVVGHSLAVINLQAGVALHLLKKRPEQLGPSLEAIRSTSKQALAELGSALATLRGDAPPDSPAGTGDVAVEAPTSLTGLAGLDNLVASLQAAGRTVHYARPAADQLQLPVAVQHTALRIAQEGLTNVVRHADPDATITVSITHHDALLVVDVADDGRHGSSAPVEGSGIAGMRARARAVGGSVVVGPLPGRGFRIRAKLPATPRLRTPTLAEPAEATAHP